MNCMYHLSVSGVAEVLRNVLIEVTWLLVYHNVPTSQLYDNWTFDLKMCIWSTLALVNRSRYLVISVGLEVNITCAKSLKALSRYDGFLSTNC